MVKKTFLLRDDIKKNLDFVIFVVVFFILMTIIYSMSAEASIFSKIFGSKTIADAQTDCSVYFGNYSGCRALNASCIWRSNNATPLQDSYCPLNYTNYNSTFGACTSWPGPNAGKTCNNITGGSLINAGCCAPRMSGGGGGGSVPNSCASFDRNETGCRNSGNYTNGAITGCNWRANDMNQNPSCYNNIGCCMKAGCWDYRGEQTVSNNCTSAIGGICKFNSYGSGCYETGGCCSPKSCSEVSTQDQCDQLQSLGNPCTWSGSACQMSGGGGFGMFNDTDSCMKKGGWWNSTGGCQMPTMGGGGMGGGGGFMFAQEARCWVGDQKVNVCQNISGCVYCTDSNTQLNNVSSACYQMSTGMCKGHEPLYSNWNGTSMINISDINTSSMTCGDVREKQTCSCGPLPNCKWSNSSATTGNFCTAGLKTDDEAQSCAPPVQFCEDPLAKNNYTLCTQLANNYMMPCKWENTTTPAQNCTFNMISMFGSSGSGGGGGMFDYNLISSETSCIAGGGTWKSEYYVDSDGSFKQDSWCEKGALFSTTTGTAFANKGNCDSDCWACEFQANGTRWSNEGNASAACLRSAKGICQWKSDSNAPNRQGYCDYPKELMFGGAKDCGSDCKACEFMGSDSSSAQSACYGSLVGCLWVNDTNAMNGKGGYCMASSKKSCVSECFSCYSQTECSNSTYHPSMNCSWDSSYNMCKPFGFTGEICFNAQDDDNDGKTDCADSDCTYDTFCGGGSIGSGSTATDCKKKFNQNECRTTRTASGVNCTWATSPFGGQSYCDYPGSDCWMFENNASANGCVQSVRGCIYRNASGGYPDPVTGTPAFTLKAFAGFCDMNKTKSNVCYNNNSMTNNQTACNLANECIWVNDSYSFSGGRCEFKPFSLCGSNINSSSCFAVSNSICSWRNDSYSTRGGFCEPSCTGKPQGQCSGFCAWKSSSCEPEAFGGVEIGGGGSGGFGGGFGCHAFDGNYSSCIAQNMTCSWKVFTQEANNANAGVCNQKGEQMMMEGMDMSPPKILGQDNADANVNEIDIREYGVKDTTKSLMFGIIVTDVSNGSICKGYYIGGGFGPMGGQGSIGAGNKTTKFYWFLDTNKNTSDGCNATTQTGTNLTGFEFLMKYSVSVINGTVSEQKSFMKCVNNDWGLTNVPLTSNRQFMCGMSMPSKKGGAMILVDKENLESFASYNKSSSMRVFVSSANDSYNENSPLDSANPGYYTSGSADFKFVDCANPANKNDEKCKQFNKFGFNVFEDCKNGIDDDSDGSADCADMKCTFTPVCSGGQQAFNFSVNLNDHESPSAMFSQIDTISDGAFIKFDSNEPANGSVAFYGNDSSCSTINATIPDMGDPSVSYDDYKPFHMVSLDTNTLAENSWANGLQNGTMYYYKTDLCDPSGNCATSACQNFTTKTSVKSFILKMKLPPGYNVSIKGGSNWTYNGNFTTNISATQWYESGVKVNTSMSRNMNVTLNCGNQSLTFIGVDVTKPKSIDMTSAFICETNSTSKLLGMNSTSKSWNQVVSDLGMGGSNDYIKLSFLVNYSANTNVSWCNDELSNCTNVNTYANCSSGGTGKTDCKIPTSLGFSAYQVLSAITAASSGEGSSSSSGGGSGGGGAGGGATAKTYTITLQQFIEGYTQLLAKNEIIKFATLDNVNHSIKINEITINSVTVTVNSTPQTATLSSGDTKKFELTGDSKYDLQITLSSITNATKATLIVKSIQELIPAEGEEDRSDIEQQPEQQAQPSDKEQPTLTSEKQKNSSIILIIVILVVVIASVIILLRKNRSS